MFSTSNQLLGHEQSIKTVLVLPDDTIVSGGTDGMLKYWSSAEDGKYELTLTTGYEHTKWITCLLDFNGNIVSGCLDGKLRMYDRDGTLKMEAAAHSGGITSLGKSKTNIISGSWDGTAKVWDEQFMQVANLPGHENGVCVLGCSDDNTIVTGSTGRQNGNTIVDCKIRVWKNHEIVATINDHQGPVRQLKCVPGIGFVSCSNDGTVKLRDGMGQTINTLVHPKNKQGDPSFILSVTVLSDGRIASASDEGFAYVWTADGTLVQTIQHPNGLWSIAAMGNGDFVTGCEDKVVRVFTCNEKRMDENVEREFQKAVEAANLERKSGPSSVDVKALPDIAQQSTMSGKSDGDIQMFRKENTAWAYSWNASLGAWAEIGEVTGTESGSGGSIDGVHYDFVVPVEIEAPGTGAIQTLKLGYNRGENTFTAAQRFIDKHSLNASYQQEIATYIEQRCDTSPVEAPQVASTTGNMIYFPQTQYLPFDDVKISKLLPTVIDFNKKISSRENVEILSEASIELLQSAISIIQETAYYHVSTFQPSMLTPVLTMLQWPSEFVFPALDIVRLLFIHPQGSTLLCDSSVVSKLHYYAWHSDATTLNAVRMLSIRALSNMLVQPATRELCVSTLSQHIPEISNALQSSKKTVQLSLATLLLNLTVCDASMELYAASLSILSTLAPTVTDPDVLLRCAMAFGSTHLKYPNTNIQWESKDISNANLSTCISELNVLLRSKH